MQMDPKKTNLPLIQPPSPPQHTQGKLESPFPTSPSPISPLLSYSQTWSSNTNSTTTSGSVSPFLSPHTQTTASSPIPLHPNANAGDSKSPNQPPHHITPDLIPPNQLLSDQMPYPLWKHRPTLPPRFSRAQSSSNDFTPNSAITSPTFLGPPSSNQFPTSPGSGHPKQLSLNQSPSKQLPHPSQLAPNQWPRRDSFFDQGSPTRTAPSLGPSPSSINTLNRAQDLAANSVYHVQPTPISPFLVSVPVPSTIPHPQIMSLPHSGLLQGAHVPPPDARVTGGNNGCTHTNTFVAQVEQHFVGQPILFIEFLILLRQLSVGKKKEVDHSVQWMTGLLGGRADLLAHLAAFAPPQHRHLIYARAEAVAAAQQGAVAGLPGHLMTGEHRVNSGEWGTSLNSIPPAYRSVTLDYLAKVYEGVDMETWKLMRIVLERYYSNLSDSVIQKEAVSQLEHILKDYPDLQSDCGILL